MKKWFDLRAPKTTKNKFVSALTQIEARSAICRLRKEKKLTPDQASSAVRALDDDLRRLVQQPVLPPVLEEANIIVERHSLRALDAVQLASAMIARDLMQAPDMRFIASDKQLFEAAQKEGFTTWNPSD